MSELESEQAVPESPEAAEPEAPAAEEWSGVSQEDYQQLTQTIQEQQEALQYMYGRLEPVFEGPQQQQGPEQIEFDPLAEDAGQQLREIMRQEFEPYREYVQAQQFREGEARAHDIIADDIASNGDFVFAESKDKARALANNYIGEMNQQYPRDPAKAAEAALHKAAADVRAWEKQVGEAYHQQQINQLSGLSGARVQQGGGANGSSQQFTIPPGGDLMDVVTRHTGGGF